MAIFSRRQFLKTLGAIATFFVADRTGFSFTENAGNLEMLVVGDSLIWGDGLQEKDKFYSLTRNWLQDELNKQVNLKVKAHSGATIFLHEADAKLLQKDKNLEKESFPGEVSLDFPTIKAQVEIARDEYEKEGKKADEINIVMLTGGIVDITVAGVLDPLGNDKVLKKQIVQFCNEDMFRFLDESSTIFPNALFVVVGYFPIFSPKTNSAEAFNAFLEVYSTPRAVKPFLNNILTRPFFYIIKSKAIRRSRIWFEGSNRELQNAVNRTNEKAGKQRAIFVKSPFTEENSIDTPNTLLFKMKAKGRVSDYLYDERKAQCQEVLDRLEKSVGLKQSRRHCEVAAIGHPTPEGAKVYAAAIQESLKKVFTKSS